MTGTDKDEAIYNGSVNFGNVFATDANNKVYRCLKDQTEFKRMTETEGEILRLAIDNSGKVYAGSINGNVYKSKKIF